MGSKNSSVFVASLARGLKILACFTREQPQLTIAEIARQTSLPQPTAWRLCHTLQQLGYLRVASNGKICLAAPVVSLGFAGLAEQPIAEVLIPYIEELAGRAQATVVLGKLEKTDIRVLQRYDGGSIVFAGRGVGSLPPLITTPTGWGCTAGLQPARREALFAKIRKKHQSLWRSVRPKLEKALVGFESNGYIISRGVLHPQLNGVSVPVVSYDGADIFAITCVGNATNLPDTNLHEIGGELLSLASLLKPVVSANQRSWSRGNGKTAGQSRI